jgi:hypothetical protein
MPFAVTLQASPNMTSFDVALEIARRALADKAWTNDGIFQSFRAYVKSIQPAAPRPAPASQSSTSATSQGAWTEAGVIDAFTRKYGNNEDAMRAMILVMSMYTLKHDNKMWFTDYAVDHQKRIIYIATNSDSNLFYRTNENAADQLFQVLSDAMFPLTGLKESWEGMTWRLLGGGGKIAGGAVSAVGGVLLILAPEPTMLTKVGGGGAAVFGANTVVDGATQLFRREGGVNLIGEGFGAYGQYMAGDSGEAAARYWVGWSEVIFDIAGGAGATKLGNVPLRLNQLPAATKASLQRAFLKLAPRAAETYGEQYFKTLALQATRNPSSNVVVLGKTFEDGVSYTKVAAHYRATYFKLEYWRELTKTLNGEQLWKINKAFLEQQIRQGKQIIVSHDPAIATGFFKQEVA